MTSFSIVCFFLGYVFFLLNDDAALQFVGGGLTVASNLRILQWQVCKKKHNKLEFQVPWWDFQLGISVNQFLSIFASRKSDFRFRIFLNFYISFHFMTRN